MDKIKRNRILITLISAIYWASLWLLTSITNNIFILLFGFLILFFVWPFINRKYYKMDEFDWKANNKASYISYMFTLFSILILIWMEEMTYLPYFWFSFKFLLSNLIIVSVLLYLWLYTYYSRNPDKL